MLWLAAKIILSVLGIFIAMFVLFLAIRESISHIRLQYYIKQQKSNCVIDKSPAFMNIVNVIKSITTFKDIWHIKKVKHTQPELLKADIYIEKDFRSCNIKINPLSEKSYIEFFQKELEHTVKTSFAGVDFLGFVHESGEKAMHQRMIFKEMFHFDRLIKTLPKIRFIIREHTSLLKKQIRNSPNRKLQIDLKNDVLDKIFQEISSYILFRDNKFEVCEMNFASVSKLELKYYNNLARNLMNSLTSGLWVKYQLDKNQEKLVFIQKEVEKVVAKEYAIREANLEKNPQAENNEDIFTIILKSNKKMREQGKEEMSMHDIRANLELFQGAATDTSHLASNSFLLQMALNPEVQKQMIEQVKALSSDYTYDQIDQNEYITAVTNEVFRTIPPVSVMVNRKVVKPMSLCGVVLRPGDSISIFPVTSNMRPDLYPMPSKFDPTRFMKDSQGHPKISKNTFIPFSTGARNCLGQYLGEFMLKVLVVEFLREFKLETVSPEWKPFLNMDPLYSVMNSNVYVEIH